MFILFAALCLATTLAMAIGLDMVMRTAHVQIPVNPTLKSDFYFNNTLVQDQTFVFGSVDPGTNVTISVGVNNTGTSTGKFLLLTSSLDDAVFDCDINASAVTMGSSLNGVLTCAVSPMAVGTLDFNVTFQFLPL
jgi:hypothetical protein